MVAQGSCNGSTCTLECKNALLAAIGTLDGSCCDQLARGTDALSMTHCDEDANRPMDEAGCRGEVAQQFYFYFDFVANSPCRHEVCNSEARAVSGVNYGVREGKDHGCTRQLPWADLPP